LKLDFGSSVSVFYNFYSDTISLKLGKIEAFSKEEELKNVSMIKMPFGILPD